jgi:ABC-type lipoprotein export system ATPase subunit
VTDKIKTGTNIIAIDGVSKHYDGGVRALDGVDLTIGHGERIAIMGPSGSGKSTLLNLISGLDRPTSGTISFEGRPLNEMSDNEITILRRRKIGLIFQTFNLLSTLTAIENVSLPLRLDGKSRRTAEVRASEMLKRLGLGDRLSHLPDALSGGERQRIAIARALVFEPPVLLADEPTGNLDSTTGEEIMGVLDELHDEFGTAIILVTHNQTAAAHCERQISMIDGRIASALSDRR